MSFASHLVKKAPPTQLPLISVSGLASNDADTRARIADQIGQAARTFGFFRITDHGIDLDLIEQTYAAAERFFALPTAHKQDYYIGESDNHRGYVPFSEKGDYPDEAARNYEAFDLGIEMDKTDPDYRVGRKLVGPNVWPDMIGFRDQITAYLEAAYALGMRIVAALETHLNLAPGRLSRQMTKPISQLRLLHYIRPPKNCGKGSVNMGAHTDYECLTLLHTRNAGLQVMSAENSWIDVPAEPNVLVVNIGDMLEAWSNGLLRSTPHRVLNLSPERFSMPFFVAANYDTTIAPLPELIGPTDTPIYEPFLAGAHLERMLKRDFPYLRRLDPPELRDTLNPFETRLREHSQT